MIHSERNLTVCAYWYDRVVSGGEFLEQSRSFLKKVVLILPELSILRVVRDPKEASGLIDREYSNFDDEVIAALPKDYVFTESGSTNRKFTKSSTAATSFRGSFLLTSDDGAKELSVRISVGTPHIWSSNNSIIEFSLDLESVESAKKILEESIEFWQPHHAYAGRYEVEKLLNQPVGNVRIGWLTYLADLNAQGALPDDIQCRRLNSGILIQATELPGYQCDAQDIEQMRRILEALAPDGYLKNPQKKPGQL
jgi:hypothetical protein